MLPLPDEEFEKGAVHELGALDDFRVRILPVLGMFSFRSVVSVPNTQINPISAGGLPSIFGLQIATYVVCSLAGKPIPHPLPAKNRWKTYDKLLRDLYVRESRMNEDKLPKSVIMTHLPIAISTHHHP